MQKYRKKTLKLAQNGSKQTVETIFELFCVGCDPKVPKNAANCNIFFPPQLKRVTPLPFVPPNP
jgi:hypothetical protein